MNKAVVVLGCKPDTDRLTERAAAASQAWTALREQHAFLICSGYASQAGLPAEANLLAAQAVSAGVPISCIIIEDKAQNSIENALNCLPILLSKSVQHVVLVTSDYHMPRCRLLFELVLQHTFIGLSWAEAYSEVSNLERSQLMQQEVKGMRHLLALGARSDFHRDMLKDRSLTHPDLLQHCADGVRLPLQPPPVALSANDKLRRSLSRKLSSGGGSMRLLMKSTSMKAKDADLQSVEEDMQLTQDLIAVAYPENNG
ncbi:hypothetical protein ABBQ38_007712 [Trebouxia sp. C0009 RCD-2024]